MSTDIVIAIATALILLAGLALGYRRGLTREAAAFIGILLGMLLVEYWADRWSGWLIQRGFDGATARLASELVLVGAPVLGGYGAGLLLRGPQSRRERGFGATLGMLNFALLGALGVSSIQRFGWGDATTASWLRSALVTRYVLDYFTLAILAIAGALVLLGLGAAINRLARLIARRRAAAPPRTAPRQAAPPAAPPPISTAPTPPQSQRVPPGQQEKFLE